MISSFRSKALERFWTRNQQGAISGDLRRKVARLLSALDQAQEPNDLDIPGLRLHGLSGDLSGYWSIRVSANWRIIFRFEGEDAVDVDLVDYH